MRATGLQRFGSFDGTEIAYLAAGTGPTVLLIHGFAADSQTNWVTPGVFDALVGAGYRVVAYDARGHGQSGKPTDPDAYHADAMPRDASALLDHLGVETVAVVGYSMGAMVATRWVTAEPRVRSVVFGGIGLRGAEGRPATRRSTIAEALLADDPRSVTDPVARAFRRYADRTGADRNALAAMQRAPRAEAPEISRITIPALVIVGDDDTLAGSPDALAEALPNATAHTVEGTHLTAVNDPQFAKFIVNFLERA